MLSVQERIIYLKNLLKKYPPNEFLIKYNEIVSKVLEADKLPITEVEVEDLSSYDEIDGIFQSIYDYCSSVEMNLFECYDFMLDNLYCLYKTLAFFMKVDFTEFLDSIR